MRHGGTWRYRGVSEFDRRSSRSGGAGTHQRHPGFVVPWTRGDGRSYSAYALDETKLCISSRIWALPGPKWSAFCATNSGSRLSCPTYTTSFASSVWATAKHRSMRSINALNEISRRYADRWQRRLIQVSLPDVPELAVAPRDAFYAETEPVLLQKCGTDCGGVCHGLSAGYSDSAPG